MKQLLALLFVALAFTSCKLSQHYTFNSDFSGHYKLEFDLTELAEFGNEDGDSVENVFEDLNTDSLKTVYENIEGISKVDVKAKDNVLMVEYKFANLDALNASLSQPSEELSSPATDGKFKYENGVFSYYFSEDLMQSSEADSLAEMMEIVDYNIVMEFKKKISEANNGVVDESKKKVTLTGNLGEVATNKKSLNLEVTFE